jgi:hypothetical protein
VSRPRVVVRSTSCLTVTFLPFVLLDEEPVAAAAEQPLDDPVSRVQGSGSGADSGAHAPVARTFDHLDPASWRPLESACVLVDVGAVES